MYECSESHPLPANTIRADSSAYRDEAHWRRLACGTITTVTLGHSAYRKVARTARSCWPAGQNIHTCATCPCSARPRLDLSILRRSLRWCTASLRLLCWLHQKPGRRTGRDRCTPVLDGLDSDRVSTLVRRNDSTTFVSKSIMKVR